MSSTNSLNRQEGYASAANDLRRNGEQWSAYESTGHCVVLAGPGSGKTKVLTTKVARMLAEDVHEPRGLACITYSSECARELERRLRTLGVSGSPNLFVGTVHSFCLTAIVQPYARIAGASLPDPLRVATESERNSALQFALGKHVSMDENPDWWEPKLNHYRRTYLDRTAPEWRGKDTQLSHVVEAYEQALHDKGVIDFEDMVLLGLRLVEGHSWIRRALHARFPILVVDEYQDLGLPLHRFVSVMCFGSKRASRLFAVGDMDQSIYGFTGAHPELLAGLSKSEKVETITLRFNYRSRQQIIAASEAALGEPRGYKAWNGEGGAIEFHCCKDGQEHQASEICDTLIPAILKRKAARALGEIAVLYPNKHVGDVIAAEATKRGLEFMRIDKNAPYPKSPVTRWLETCAAWCCGGWKNGEPRFSDILSKWGGFWFGTKSEFELRSLRNKLVRFLLDYRRADLPLHDWLAALLRASLRDLLDGVPTLRDEREHVKTIGAACAKGKPLDKWTVARFGGQLGAMDQLKLMTLHSSKGLEFDVVFMLGMDQGVLPRSDLSQDAKREPRRLFYVGITRARREVHLLYSGWIKTRYGRKSFGPASEFVREVMKATSAQS